MGLLTAQKGNQGSYVAFFQDWLNKKGDYNLELDGIFGDATEKAVRDFQAKNGLKIDGIIGADTIKALQKASDYVAPPKASETKFEYSPFEYKDFEKSDDTLNAENKKTDAEDAVANYGDFSYDKENTLADIMDKILNREKFSYDFNGDAFYQQYKDKYIKQGKMAMQDTIGQASAMTGGYGNSYAATAGNQAYQAHLENLNDVIPELYQMALDRYNQEGQDLHNQMAMLSEDKAMEYGIWGDKLSRLESDRDYWGTEANNSYNKDRGEYESDRTFEQGNHNTEEGYKYQSWADAVDQERWEKEFEEGQRQYNEELAFRKQQYNDSKVSNSGSSGSSSGSSSGGGKSSSSSGSSNSSNNSNNNTQTSISPKKSSKTDSFIGTHSTKDEFMARGDKTYKEFLAYIESEIEKEEGNLSDEELLYLINYYGLS